MRPVNNPTLLWIVRSHCLIEQGKKQLPLFIYIYVFYISALAMKMYKSWRLIG